MKIFVVALLICGVFHQTSAVETVIEGGSLVLTTSVNGSDLIVRAVGDTQGYIGFGVSPDGSGMTGADIIMAGCSDDTQEPYAVDFIGSGNSRPNQDIIQNVVPLWCEQNETHTTVEFIRPIASDDADQDLPINTGDVFIIWSMGNTDSLSNYHGARRGVVTIDILGE